MVVGATPSQIHNLMTINNGDAQQELFDLILIDEASQMDVANAILAFCSLAGGGSVVLAGDPKQLPPIQQAEPPVGLEALVGCVYTFCEEAHDVPSEMLEVNYRSNSTLVEFSLNAGYRTTLTSHSPDLRLNLVEPLPTSQPADWPPGLYWTPEWSAFLNPDCPAVCFVYPEGRSSQWNQFEADAIAALVFLLHNRTAEQLLNERSPLTGQIVLPATNQTYSLDGFWESAIGVVTPHRAQQGLIISRLQQTFAATGVAPSVIRSAVDTVERFQGQQRDVILASYALGDPDAIHDEDEFLMSLNRFNVMASRARAKLIVLVSQEVADHLSSNLDTLRESRLLKIYVESFCGDARPMTLGFLENGVETSVAGTFKHR
jgi:superfamily I DNA and/or RNA helicase